MKTSAFTFILILQFITSFSFGQEISEKQQTHVAKFITAVTNHDQKSVIKLMDKKYRKEQIAFLKGNKEQFVNELFGGSDVNNSDIYVQLKLNEITKIEVAEVIELKGGEGYTYIFRIRGKEKDVYISLGLKKTGKKYGFIGSVG